MQTVANLLVKIKNYLLSHKKISFVLLGILVILLFIFRPRSASPLESSIVKRHTLVQTASVSGSIDAVNKVDLSFLTGGQLVYIGAKKNDIVSAGQTIAQEDNRTVLKNLQAALLSYNLQRDTFDQTAANNGNRSNPNDAVNDTMKRVLQDNQYNLDKAINSIELQDLARQQSFLVSPINGILTRADAVSAGTTVLPTTVFEVVDPTSLIFSMDVDEADIGKIQPQQRVNITLDAYPDIVYHLTVDSIDYVSHTTANGGTAYSVKVKLPGDDISRFRIGLNGNADIITARKENILTIPISALFNDTYVYVQIGKKYKKQKVTLGLQNDTDTEVLSGLHAGDIVTLQPSKVPQKLVLNK
jgi:RND family efflux transporter MFP subunit